ncbi:MAG TPA: hydroxymethylbilane synthase [Holophagaceae bacterium]|nr:hydroxymethylbilane synthase [Holophagaceae bacterium]
MKQVIVATRGSELAKAQAAPLVDHLRAKGYEISWRLFTTSGDQWLEGPLDKVGGTGFFTKELEAALLAGEADLLIHSLKDVALDRPEGIVTACIPEREDPSDWLLLRQDAPPDPVIGTSAVRRERLLKAAMPNASFTWLRGNVPTRVQRVKEGVLRDAPLHGAVLAGAGLRRLGLDLSGLLFKPLRFDQLVPAPGQGALLAETRADRPDLIEAFADLNDLPTAEAVWLERRVLRGIGGGCQQPLGAHAEHLEGGGFRLRAAYAGEDGVHRGLAEGGDAAMLVREVLRQLGVSCV